MFAIDPTPAAVRPRVHTDKRGTVLLEDLVAEFVESGEVSELEIQGPRGSGITTAMLHLEHLFGVRFDLEFFEYGPAFTDSDQKALIRFPTRSSQASHRQFVCRLSRWERDEWIEYLLVTHKGQCASVMSRIQNDPLTGLLDGNPNVWRQVLDHMAADQTLTSIRAALYRILETQFADWPTRRAVGRHLFENVATVAKPAAQATTSANLIPNTEQARLLLIPGIRILLLADAAWDELQQPDSLRVLNWPRHTVDEVAHKVARSPQIQEKLKGWLEGERLERHSLAASLLHAAHRDWLPSFSSYFQSHNHPPRLTSAILDGADCCGKDFTGCELTRASLIGVNFTGATLQDVNARDADFDDAKLLLANVARIDATNATFIGADFSQCRGESANFTEANLSFADLSEAHLGHGNFIGANLRNANLQEAQLAGASFRGACIDDANFANADLESADLTDLDLSVACFDQARFVRAVMYRCQMEGMELPYTDFESAILFNANMTGSIMTGANFAKADLTAARMAEVDWEGASLRNANLTGATFHMGSSRSGLVGSSIPMHGSRTGFYTDDLNEQDFKSPEEIRKANLRGVDLRGARIGHVDFYLVDLREALYDPEQEDQLRRTGAILSPKP